MNGSFKNLKVYKMAYQLAMELFELTQEFHKHQAYSLTDPTRRSSRSICTNIAQGYRPVCVPRTGRKRKYPRHFTSKITDADGEASETMIWLEFAKDCG